MNFWKLRSTNQIATQRLQPLKETQVEASYVSKAAITLEGQIAEEPFQESISSEIHDVESDKFGHENGSTAVSSGKNNSQADNHIDVTKDKGFLIIPYKEIPANWTEAPDILSFQSLDRHIVFPGEQIQILACLFDYKHDTEIITPFKVAAVLNKNGIRKKPMKQDGYIAGEANPDSETLGTSSVTQDDQHGNIVNKGKIDSHKNVSSGESFLRMEDQERQTGALLQRFKNSHFFARIAESNEPLWSKRRVQETNLETSATFEEKLSRKPSEPMATTKQKNGISAAIDRGIFDAQTSGGVARGSVECCSLANGDIVVLLEVNVGVQFVGDLILEILQFEKYQERKLTLENRETPALNQDPSGELLKWLLPLDNSIPPLAHPLPPSTLSSSSIIRSTPTKPPTVSGSSSSQRFSFGNLRSYSMSSLPPNMTPPLAVTTPNAKPPIFAPEDWNQFSFKKCVESGKSGSGGLISFRGVPLQPERFSVQCGLEGIYMPGIRWRKKIELIQPLEIHSFSVDCNTDDLFCVSVKNVSPAHAPDVVVFVDAITVVFEEASKSAPPLFLPIACVESGNNFTLPNLALRRGEEHSFILKPATTFWKHPKGQSHVCLRPTHLPAGNAASSWYHSTNTEGKHTVSHADQYSVIVTCRCNYTESRLFFKHPTSWRPRISRDLMISVASEMCWRTLGSEGTQLPVQVLTLQASNMTSDNLTLTVLAPASFTSPPSMAPLSNSLPSALSPLSASAELAKRKNSNRGGAVLHGLSSVSLFQGQKEEDGSSSDSINQQTVPISDMVPDSDSGRRHLWLQSRAPLGCIPSQSTATVKLEVLPLTDGIITLDSLQIEVKEKGVTYIPEQSLKTHATSSIATGIF